MSRSAPSSADRNGNPAGVETSYVGETARAYLVRRQGSLKWRLEQAAVEALLGDLPAGSTVLDAPVGTGRFLRAMAENSHRFVGVDVSRDMLSQARAALEHAAPAAGHLVQGTILALPFRDGAVDCVLSIRLLNWFDSGELGRTLGELRRVCRDRLVVGVRLDAPLRWRHLPRMAAELLRHPASSLRRLLSRPASRGRPILTNHPEKRFLALLDELHLSVERALPIDDGTVCTRRLFRYTPLRIFVLSVRHDRPQDS